MTGMLKGCLNAGCQIELQMRAIKLLTDPKDGAVAGANSRCRPATRGKSLLSEAL
jgi:hypothetical protein